MPRPDKAERARRQALARERKDREEGERLAAEEREQDAATDAHEAWLADYEKDRLAEEEVEYAERAVKALDELAALYSAHSDSGDEIDIDHIRDILSGARHPDFLPDPGWCGTGA